MTSFRQPEFLSDNDIPRSRIRCPIHGFIRYSENERRIMDHPLVQRLRYIRQLALTELVYPGATHTRFEHSLGVMEASSRAFDALCASHGPRMEAVFASVPGFEKHTLALARQYLRLAALLHDGGHACFSHAAEEVIGTGQRHEALSLQIIREPELLGSELARLFGADCPRWVAQLIDDDTAALPPQLRLVKNLISGEMDADRMDYLLRDAHHCGVDYGRFDHLRLIESLELYEDVSGELQLAVNRGGVHAFEALILARYQMNTQVYYHRLRRAYDHYLKSYFRSLGRDALVTRDQVLAATDVTALAGIFEAAALEPTQERVVCARRIVHREHHRVIHETSDHANADDVRQARNAESVLRDRFPERDVFLDVAKGNNHKLVLPEDEDDRGLVRMAVIGRNGAVTPIGEESQILRRIPRRFQCARLFALTSRGEEALQSEMEGVARSVRR